MAIRVAKIALEIDEETYYIDITKDSDRDHIALSLLEKFKDNLTFVPENPDGGNNRLANSVKNKINKLELITGEGEAFADYQRELNNLKKELDMMRRRYQVNKERQEKVEDILLRKDGKKAFEMIEAIFPEYVETIEVHDPSYGQEIIDLI